MKRAIIVGSDGQDGSYLFDQLVAAGASVVGIGRGVIRTHGDLAGDLPTSVQVLDAAQTAQVVELTAPDEIYYLAAHHHSAQDKGSAAGAELFRRSYETHVLGLVNFLEAIVRTDGKTRLFYAASSHVFGDTTVSPQDEQTPLSPRCVYGITKVSGMQCCRLYRREHGVHASVGILYNHESPRRRVDFVTRKVARAAVAISRKEQSELVVGNLAARVDWGYAPDYVDAMIRIVAQPTADDYVVATGQTRSVEDLIAAAFGYLGMDWKEYVRVDSTVIAKSRPTVQLVGNAAKLRATTGWAPSVTFAQMVGKLVKAELDIRS